MATPLGMPAVPVPLSLLWRAISSLTIVRRLLGIPDEQRAPTSATHGPVRLGSRTFDWEGPDTSLTQAELEVLK
jgi:hypothetical protein